MPIYTKRTNQNKYSKKQIAGICLTVFFSLLLINLMFGIVAPINTFCLGVFGLMYAVTCMMMIALGILMILEKKMSNEYRFEAIIGFISTLLFLLLVHLATVSNIPFTTLTKTMKAVFDFQYTMGGMFFTFILYPIIYLTHKVAAMVILMIPLVILVGVLILRMYKRVTNQLVQKEKKFSVPVQNLVQKELQEFEDKQLVEQESAVVDDNIFITDQSLVETEQENDEVSHAKELLGLSPRKDVSSDIFIEDKPQETEHNEDNKRPRKIIHREDIWHEDYPSKSYTQGKVLTENERKNLAFLRATQGKPTDDLKQPQKQDLYDNQLNKNNYKQFVKPKFENPEVKYDKFNNNDFNIKTQQNPFKNQNSFQNQNFQNDNFQKQKPFQNNFNYNNQMESTKDEEETKWSFPSKFDNTEDDFLPVKKESSSYKASNVLGNYNQMFYNSTKENREEKQTSTNESNAGRFNNQQSDSYKKSVEQEKPVERPKPKKPYRYIAPPIDLLNKVESSPNNIGEDFEEKATMLEQTLASFNLKAKVVSIVHGPTFSRFELQMPPGIPVRRVSGYVDDIAMALESHGNIRMEIPIKGKSAFGVEVPNRTTEKVPLRDIIDSDNFRQIKSPTAFALGKDITGEAQVTRIDKLKHVLIAGSTGSGKSVCMNSLLLSILYKASPEDVRLLIIDPKRVEFTPYNGIPHLLIPNVICEVDKAVMALKWAIDEMERRFALFSKEFVRDLGEYNQTESVRSGVNPKLPYLLIIVDELADLMLQNKKEIEDSLNRLLAKSRAAGIHLILATQRPSVDVITGTLKNNLPAKIAFKVSSAPDSKTILGSGGAEKLLGRGDMLFVPEDNPDGHRIQGALVENSEIAAVVNFVKENNEADFDETIEEAMFNKNSGGATGGIKETEYDPLFKDACRNTIIANSISISKIQRLFGIGYPRAAKIVDQMVAAGYISDRDSNNKYTIFITQQEFEEKFGEDL